MENKGNQNLASTLCSAGCGFFGNPQFNGMCSKCYKDFVKRKQSNPNDSSTLLAGPTSSAPAVSQNAAAAPVPSSASNTPAVPDTTPSVETAMPTVTTIVKSEAGAAASSSEGSPMASSEEAEGSDSPGKAKKRNRCSSCNKKVGLTGFECRCGGLYCSIHRYSDKHNCQFDYKVEGADYIRKNNPVVIRSKVQKL